MASSLVGAHTTSPAISESYVGGTTSAADVLPAEGQRAARGDPDLLADDVHAGQHLRHGVACPSCRRW
ncbi:hypothetical protein [Nonomuraea pusilla]|uniref:hypothetical protein n=1 Tax=Nonomuraea pusilla TaxID=46177 RepID=UPI000B8735B7|nr:hypothetical protein [Nonomuraea pusilla]